MNLRQIFIDVPIGTVCTGTIHYYQLSAKDLRDEGIVRTVGDRYTPLDYIFSGFRDRYRELEHQDEPPV